MTAHPEEPTADTADSVTFTIPHQRRTAGYWILGLIAGLQLLLFLGLGLWDGNVPWLALLILAICLIPAFVIAWWLSRFVYDPKELKLVVSRDGIYAPRMAQAPIPWSAIEGMAIKPYYTGPYGSGLVLTLTVPDAARFGPRGRNIVRRLSHWRFGSDLLFPVSGLDRPAGEIADTIERFAPASLMTLRRRGL